MRLSRLTALFLSMTSSWFAAENLCAASEESPNNNNRYNQYLYERIPSNWGSERVYETTLPSDDRWWKRFNDPVLDSLITLGEKQSLDLRMALKRIEASQYNLRAIKGGYSPTIGVATGWTKSRTSGDTETIGQPGKMSYFNLGLNFNWEIDIFGRIREQSKMGKAEYLGTRAEYESAMISLCGNIATAYINLRYAQQNKRMLLDEIADQQKMLAITEARHKAGLVSKLDVTQSKTVLFTTQASLPSINAQIKESINTLSTLLGVYPEEISAKLLEYSSMPAIAVPDGLVIPADMIRRRPDIAQAEYVIIQYAAKLGIAKKDWLPALALTGSFGVASHNIGDMFKNNSVQYNISPQLSWTVFEGLSRDNRIAMAREEFEAEIDNYNLTVISAINEVRTQIAQYEANQSETELRHKVTEQSLEALTLAADRYKQGLDPYINVMDAQKTRLSARQSELQSKASLLVSLVKLYVSMAGSPLTTE